MSVAYVCANIVGKCGGIPTTAYHEVLALYNSKLLKLLFCNDYLGEEILKDCAIVTTGTNDKEIMDCIVERHFDNDCDVLHSWGSHTYMSARKLKQQNKILIFTFADPFLPKPLLEERVKFNIPLYREGENEAWNKLLWNIRDADYIIANSNFTKRGIVNVGMPAEKVFINHSGVDLPEKIPPYPEEFKASFLGTSCLRKGTPYLIQAFAKTPEIKLLLQGGYHPELHKFLESSLTPNIEMGGYSIHIFNFFAQTSVYIQPGIVDGCPLTILEAMAYERPVIATTNCGSGELIEDGKSGFIIPIRSPEAIIEKVLYFKDNPSEIERMGKNARKIVENHTWENNEKKLSEIYKIISS